MTDQETTKISICTDCMVLLANGEVPDDDHRGDPNHYPLSAVEGEDISLGMLTEEHNDGCTHEARQDGACECESLGFSMSTCDGCGSPLGGDRHAATIWHKVHVEAGHLYDRAVTRRHDR